MYQVDNFHCNYYYYVVLLDVLVVIMFSRVCTALHTHRAEAADIKMPYIALLWR